MVLPARGVARPRLRGQGRSPAKPAGYAPVVPMEDLDLHFTGDLHAISAANNLLAAIIDNHLQFENELRLDPRRISWKRCLSERPRPARHRHRPGRREGRRAAGDRLRHHRRFRGDGDLLPGRVREDLVDRLSRIVVGFAASGERVTAGELRAAGAMAALLSDALLPNLVQTAEARRRYCTGAHSETSPTAAARFRDAAGAEARRSPRDGGRVWRGPGGGEVLRHQDATRGLAAGAAVFVATVRALKMHGGDIVAKPGKAPCRRNCCGRMLRRSRRGRKNLKRGDEGSFRIVRRSGVPAVVAINRFPDDTAREIDVAPRQAPRGSGGRRGWTSSRPTRRAAREATASRAPSWPHAAPKSRGCAASY